MNETAVTASRPGPADVPLVIDLDGTLLRCDTLHESALRLLAEKPWTVLQWPGWLLKGKAHLKREIAARVDLDVATLPIHAEVHAWAEACRQEGRSLVLCSASDGKYAAQVAAHLGLFEEVIASDGRTNVSAERKADELVRRYGARGFDYAGNSADDLPVWAQARKAIVVGAGAGLRDRAARVATVERHFEPPPVARGTWLKALRLHQWAKNLLIFLPLLASHRITEVPLLVATGLAFLAFGLCASSVYILNDLMDLPSDRLHSRKRNRPFASGALSPTTGLVTGALLLVAAFAIGWLVPPAFNAWLAVYFGLTLYYTFVLKRKILVDALSLAALYTLRILAGGAAAGIWPGFWLLALSLFLFLSLAFVKRYSELKSVFDSGGRRSAGRDYRVSDLPLIETLGIVSGFSAVMVVALYINSEAITRLYPNQDVMWLTVPTLLYWIARMWVKAHRGEMHDDPVVFAVSDGLSLLTIAVFAALTLIAAVPW